MSRNICICLKPQALTEAHKAKIRQVAEETGFVPHFFTMEEMDKAKACLQDCEILFAHDPGLLRSAPATLKWYCCAFAGVDPYCKNDGIFANPDCILTNSNVYGVTIAEHVIMAFLMMLRRMPEYMEIVRNQEWENQLPIRSIRGNCFTILGTGNIGQEVATRLRGMGAAKIVGVSRSGRPVEGIFDEVYPITQLDDVLKTAANLIMALPGTPETIGILTRQRIALLPQGAYIANVGRGTAIDQTALIDALESGHLAGAALDVMDPEPLPKGHPLWSAKNLLITPHISGNMTLDYTCDAIVDSFCADLKRYAAGEPLKNVVNRTLGY